MKRIKAVIVKEIAHILRDPTSLTIVFLMPLVMMFIFGYSINFDLDRVEAGIIDHSQSQISQQLVKKFLNNKYFVLQDLVETTPLTAPQLSPLAYGERLLKAGKLKEIIIIPEDFAQKINDHRNAEIGIIIDGSDSNVANLVYQYNELIIMDFISGIVKLNELVKIHTRILFNPELKSAFFFIPGLVATLLVMISALLTSLSISREKESGSIDLLFISPLKSPEIIIGKTIPYIFVSLMAGCLILLFSRFWFKVPIKGNLLVLLIFSVLYIITSLSLGILISTVAPTQKVAMFMTLLITLLPSYMLSGFIFPIPSLPLVLRLISRIIPATYFLRIIRGVVVKGADLKDFIPEGIALVIFTIILLAIASLKFAKDRKKAK